MPASWRIYIPCPGWGAMVFRMGREEPFLRRRVDSQGGGDARTEPNEEVAKVIWQNSIGDRSTKQMFPFSESDSGRREGSIEIIQEAPWQDEA